MRFNGRRWTDQRVIRSFLSRLAGSMLLWVVLFVQAVSSQVGPQAGEVIGQVIDERTRQPVTAATVGVISLARQTATDSTGVFRLSLPPGRHALRVVHLAFEAKAVEILVEAAKVSRILVILTEAAVELEPLTVEAVSAEERRRRGLGVRRAVVTRDQIEKAEDTNLTFGEMLRLAVPMVQVRRQDRVLGSPVCIELRTIRTAQASCLSPAVYMDGVPISNPTSLYDNLPLNMIESLEVVPAAESGVMFGSGALYGALLIQTRKPGVLSADDAARTIAARRPNFDWAQEDGGHSTTRVFLSSLLGNTAGLALGVAAASQCLGLRKPAYDGIISDCGVVPSIGTGAAAILLPALGSGFASGLAGRTENSKGLLAPATLGSAMAILPAYALVFSGYRNESDGLKWAGYGIMLLGSPLIATAADYLFRKGRGN